MVNIGSAAVRDTDEGKDCREGNPLSIRVGISVSHSLSFHCSLLMLSRFHDLRFSGKQTDAFFSPPYSRPVSMILSFCPPSR